MSVHPLPPEMFEHYRKTDESQRLSQGTGELERIRTQDILKRFLPTPPAAVLDVGGGTGVYALWLAKEGYQVHMIDPVAHHVDQAREASSRQPDRPLRSCTVGDARSLSHSSGDADAVLLLGPLYHLIDQAERFRALREAHRVLRSGGRVFAAAVSRFASMLDWFAAKDPVEDFPLVETMKHDLRTGQHRNPTENPQYFTTTFFHHPEELRNELTASGFHLERLLAVEGPFWFMQSFRDFWPDPDRRQLLLEVFQTIEEEPSLLGASAHMIGIARK